MRFTMSLRHTASRPSQKDTMRWAISKYRLPTHILAKVIGCAPETIGPLPKEMRVMFLQTTSVMSAHFLCGIWRLPVILGHDHALLREHWTILPQWEELRPFDEWIRDRWRLLNVLQYFIERKQFQTSSQTTSRKLVQSRLHKHEVRVCVCVCARARACLCV